ncbi:hypothetical protein QTP81_07930 [Alteromonas sp. ASW11-36]|uniref:EexN family lipoprotein n=1 Tax=Alteromonas arenosi TaxID=3055817 RepID=A0ABT7SYB5_9ALTE|nr:hypothetical protein [Alteromonas sp. ASW11-36]MDM7860522.1 hypothetical protein [Alteromonas sp. ASW11-36]
MKPLPMANQLGRLGFVVCVTAFTLGCVSTHERNSSKYASDGTANNDDGVICRMEKRTGSNMMTRVCRTAEERAVLEQAGREGFERLQRTGITSNADGQ